LVPVVVLLAGCKDTVIVEDNSPNKYESESAMGDFVGQGDVRKAPFEHRLACTQTVYGR
jgi:hypothetical protein